MKWAICILFLSYPISILAQSPTSTQSIANTICSNYKTEDQRASAIYTWVTSNIKYCTDSANQINLGLNPEAKITEALRRGKGVCENYAAIFTDICSKSGLAAYVVDGYTKQSGYVVKVGHSWCAVRIHDSWGLCDPTWDEGSGDNPLYYLMESSDFIQTHMPYDPLWQLLKHPLSYQEFKGGLSNSTTKKDWNYVDSIKAFLELDSLERLKASAARIQNNGPYNDLVRNRENFLKMHLEIIYQDRDTELYKLSVADLNAATNIYNRFIEYRNNQFMPSKTDSELRSLLEVAANKLLSANKKIDELNQSKATLTINTDAIRTRVNNLMSKLRQQEEFVKLYLNSAMNERKALFYK